MRERGGEWKEGIMDLVMVVIELVVKYHLEEDVCKGWGIDLVWGLGDKVQSSSWLLEKYNNLRV